MRCDDDFFATKVGALSLSHTHLHSEFSIQLNLCFARAMWRSFTEQKEDKQRKHQPNVQFEIRFEQIHLQFTAIEMEHLEMTTLSIQSAFLFRSL